MDAIKSFAISSLSDDQLFKLLSECQGEQERREQERQKKRKRWIDRCFCAYLAHPNACVEVIGETTIVAVYTRYEGLRMEKATPAHGDKYEPEVGIAVAFAKCCGESIPDYI